jgi:hypothetical protein
MRLSASVTKPWIGAADVPLRLKDVVGLPRYDIIERRQMCFRERPPILIPDILDLGLHKGRRPPSALKPCTNRRPHQASLLLKNFPDAVFGGVLWARGVKDRRIFGSRLSRSSPSSRS